MFTSLLYYTSPKHAMRVFLLGITTVITMISGAKQLVSNRANSVEIVVNQELFRIEPISEAIIHLEITPMEAMPISPSFMVQETLPEFTNWSVSENEDKYRVNTSQLSVEISKTSGVVTFFDSHGKKLLSELENARSYSQTVENGESTYEVQQTFDGSGTHVIYGLGGHQNGKLNFKGKDALLEQYNTVDIVPFFWTDSQFGILWDNNSITRFGDPRKYEDLSAVKLWGKDGTADGLTAEYYLDAGFINLQSTRQESEVGYEYLEDNENYPEGFNPKLGSVRWEGYVESPETGDYKFKFYGSHYAKVWLDGELVVDRWRQNWMPGTHELEWHLEQGKKHHLRIDWICNDGYASLKCLSPESEMLDEQISLTSEVGEKINYYFVYGRNGQQIIENYRKLTGTAPMMPKWAFGFWQSRERYKTQEELLEAVREFRKREIGIDNIVLDWNYWEDDQWGSHEFDAARFPEPVEMIRELHEDLNTQIMISVWPKFYPETEHFQEMDREGYLYRRNYELGIIDWIGYQSTFYDAFNPGARKLFFEQIDEELFAKGIDALWLDATEPDIESNISIAERKLRMDPTADGRGSEVFNAFSINNAQGIYEEYRDAYPDKRVFILTRSAYAGQHRYGAVTWSGDVASRWEDLKYQIPYGLNLSAAGTPYWTTDIGGFAVEKRYETAIGEDLEEFRELNTRWYQFGAFCPLFRVHGQYPFREIYNIAPEGHPAYKSMAKYNQLRYRLMPYIYSLGAQVTFNHEIITRPLLMEFPSDFACADIKDQFMFGSEFLVCPVTDAGVDHRPVYLPENKAGWYDFHSNQWLEGGKSINAAAPYEDLPLFVKAGSIVITGPDIQYVDQKNDNSIDVWIYSGTDAQFTLYDDDGRSYDYENGEFSFVDFNWDEHQQELSVQLMKGDFTKTPMERKIRVHLISKNGVKTLGEAMFEGTPIHIGGLEVSR